MENSKKHPDFSKIPKGLFWDTDFDAIDWENKYIAVIQRIYERGNDEAKKEIEKFYGKETVSEVLQLEATKPMRLYTNFPRRFLVIGDQHGALKAVLQVLERCKFNPEEDLLINLGDVVDGWSESSQLVQFYIELSEKCNFKPIFLKGNHDALCQKWLESGVAEMNWLTQGGESTIKSYSDNEAIDKKSHLEFFNNMKDFYIDLKNRGFVHAGFTSEKGLGFEKEAKTYNWDRSLWESVADGFYSENWPKIFNSHSEIFIGHTPTIIYNEAVPANRLNLWNIDTGAAFTGKVTILDIDTKEFWQSDKVMDLYPNEKGRKG